MEPKFKSSLQGFRIVSFESRRGREMAELIRNYGGEPFVAPAMREVPLGEDSAAIDLIGQLEAGRIDFLILLTGVGTRTLLAAVAETYPRERVVAALGRTTLVARGPKPVAALGEVGLAPAIRAPEPNTWREILIELDTRAEIRGRRVAVQEYGVSNQELISGLVSRGAEVARVPVYRWALPEDTAPLRSAIERILHGQADVAVFTNATQVTHLFQLAEEERPADRLRQSLSQVLVASIGPVCTEALEQRGVRVDLEPDHPKMGHLIAALASRGRELLESKRKRSSPAAS